MSEPTGEDIASLRQQGLTWGRIGNRYGLSGEAVRGRWRRWWGREHGDDEKEPPSSEEHKPTRLELWREHFDRLEKRPDWRELVEHAQRGAEIQAAYRPVLNRATRRIVTDRPVFLSFPADLHLGSPYAEYRAFTSTTDLLLSDGRFYISIVGPDLETAFAWFRSADAVLNQVLPPWLQIELFRQWLNEMLAKCLSICGDNHTDERLERYLGDIGLVWRDDVPYFRTWGILTVEVGPEGGPFAEYEIVQAHRYKGHSIYHDLQPALRMMRDIYPIADAYVTAHTHTPFHMDGVFYPEARPLKPRQHFIVTGTFKTGPEPYGMRNYGGSGILGIPTLALWPGQYKMQYFKSPEMALEVMGGNVQS